MITCACSLTRGFPRGKLSVGYWPASFVFPVRNFPSTRLRISSFRIIGAPLRVRQTLSMWINLPRAKPMCAKKLAVWTSSGSTKVKTFSTFLISLANRLNSLTNARPTPCCLYTGCTPIISIQPISPGTPNSQLSDQSNTKPIIRLSSSAISEAQGALLSALSNLLL